MQTIASVSFFGYINDHYDALLLITAARKGIIPRFRRRLNTTEQRQLICSGSVFLWTEEESCMKRWTDGYPWSPSRIHQEFLLYREMAERGYARSRTSSRLMQNDNTEESLRPDGDQRRKAIRVLAGSLFNNGELDDLAHWSTSGGPRPDDVFKRGGLMKKTFSLSLPGETWHLVAYYTLDNVLSSRLMTPQECPFFEGMAISEDVEDCYALSARRQALGTCIQSVPEPAPSLPYILNTSPSGDSTYSSPNTSECLAHTFTQDEWHNMTNLIASDSTYASCVLQSSFACASFPYDEGVMGKQRYYTIEDTATGWR